MKKISRKEVVKFALAGFISFLVHNIVYLTLNYFEVNPTLAYSAGYISWVVVNFVLSNYMTFKTKPTVSRAVGFAISSCLFYLIQLGGFWLWSWLQVPDVIITPLVYMMAFPINFLMVRYVMHR